VRFIGECLVRSLCRVLIFFGACGWLVMMILKHIDDDDQPRQRALLKRSFKWTL